LKDNIVVRRIRNTPVAERIDNFAPLAPYSIRLLRQCRADRRHHRSAVAAQALAGESSLGKNIRPFMPDQHREFFSLLSYVFAGVGEEQGWPVAPILMGSPGFVTSPDPKTLRIDALPTVDDPLARGVRQGAEVGLLGLDLSRVSEPFNTFCIESARAGEGDDSVQKCCSALSELNRRRM
jgi:hypothetical protein